MNNFETLKLNKEFLRLYRRGKSDAKAGVIVYGQKTRRARCRIGITTSKKIGNAVERNRSRRVIMAAWQEILKNESLSGSWDFVFVARGKTKHLKSTDIFLQMKSAMIKIGAISADEPKAEVSQ